MANAFFCVGVGGVLAVSGITQNAGSELKFVKKCISSVCSVWWNFKKHV